MLLWTKNQEGGHGLAGRDTSPVCMAEPGGHGGEATWHCLVPLRHALEVSLLNALQAQAHVQGPAFRSVGGPQGSPPGPCGFGKTDGVRPVGCGQQGCRAQAQAGLVSISCLPWASRGASQPVLLPPSEASPEFWIKPCLFGTPSDVCRPSHVGTFVLGHWEVPGGPRPEPGQGPAEGHPAQSLSGHMPGAEGPLQGHSTWERSLCAGQK